jgi:hypothetical protein
MRAYASARRPSRWIFPRSKFHFTPSNGRDEWIGVGFWTSTPPSASTSCWKPLKFTWTMWLISKPVSPFTVRMRSGGPPAANAELIFASPTPGTGTRRSRGIERSEIVCASGSVRRSRIESARSPDATDVVRLSLPMIRLICGLKRIRSDGASAARVRGVTRLFAFSTSFAKAR